MWFKQKLSVSKYVILISCAFLPISYQQYSLVSYAQHNTLSTISSFWNFTNCDCKMDTNHLIDVYKKLSRSYTAIDQFIILLRLQVQQELMEMMSLQLKDALLEKHFRSIEIFKQNANKLQEIDESILKSLGANVIFKDNPKDIIEQIMLIKDIQQKVPIFYRLLTYRINSLFNNKSANISIDTSLNRLYSQLPKELRLLYENVRDDKRIKDPVKFKFPNNNDSYCASLLYNDLGSFSYINLYAYNNTKIRSYDPTDILMSSWWDVIWPHGFNRRNNTGYIMLQYKYSGKLLCLVELKLVELSFSENYLNPSCHWLITYATEDEIKSGCRKSS